MLHTRQLTFSPSRIRTAQIICHHQTQHGVAEKLERFVVKFARLVFVAGRNFLMRPGTVRDGPFEQSTIFKLVSQNGFEESEIGNRVRILQNAAEL